MRFLMTVHADEATKTGAPPNPKLIERMHGMAAELLKSGKMVATGGLGWSLPSTRITLADDKLTMIDGPFPETKELIAGFALFDLTSKEEAIELSKQFMNVHREVLGASYRCVMEIHQVFGA
jgi:hypothetical protein